MPRALDRDRQLALHLSGQSAAPAWQDFALRSDIGMESRYILVVRQYAELSELTDIRAAVCAWAEARLRARP